MVKNKILGHKYASAFLNIFSDQLKISDADRCQGLAQYLREHSDFFLLLQAPFIRQKKQAEVLKKLWDQFKLPPVFQKLADLLRSGNRLSLLPDVLQACAQEFKKRENFVLFSIKTAHELSKHDRAIIEDFLHKKTDKTIQPTYTLDTKLIAGLRLQSSTLLWEYSIQKQLQAIRRQFVRRELSNGY